MRASKFTRRATLALTVGTAVLAGSLAAGAFEATQAEADRIRGAIEDYIGHPAPGAPRIVDLLPKGEAYDLVIDVTPLLAPLNTGEALKVNFGRFVSRLAPLPDGTWRNSYDSFPAFSIATGADHTEVHYDGLDGEAIFDPAKQYFTRTTMRAAKLSATSTHPQDDKGPGAVAEVVQDGLALAATAAPAASGTGVDVALTQKIAKFTETVRTTGAAETGVPDMTMTLAAIDHTVDMRLDGLRHQEVLDLWKWVVAHGGFDAAKTDPAAFKQRLAALGPLFDTFAGKVGIRDLGIETPFGIGGATVLDTTFDGTGLGTDGRFAFGVTIADLKIHSMLAPAWATRLLPTDLDVKARFSGWSLAPALAAWLEIMDFANPHALTPDETARLGALALPKGVTTIDLAGNHMKGALWDLTLDGKIDTNASGAKGDITVRATGLDAVVASLNGNRDPNAQQALGALTMATTLATRDGAAHVWRFAFDGSAVTLNGQPFGPQKAEEPAAPAPVEAPPPSPKKQNEPKANEPTKKKLQQKI